MDKIASSRELLGELQRIRGLAQAPNPSRVLIAGELHALAERLVVAMKVDWTVKTPAGTFKKKKDADSLEQAQRYAAKFISQANGNEKLEDALGKDFTKA